MNQNCLWTNIPVKLKKIKKVAKNYKKNQKNQENSFSIKIV